MANSKPELDLDHYEYDDDNVEDDYSDDERPYQVNHRQSPVRNDRKFNGTVSQVVDRYGFIGGKQFTNPDDEHRLPPEILRKRELKWLDMIENWEKWMSKKFKKVKERCRKGIPSSIRPRAWQYLCGSKYLLEHNEGRYDHYLSLPGDPRCLDDIKKDLDRQFPQHEMFRNKDGYGQEDLFFVLKAYSIHKPEEGYCQAQAPLAALLLMHMPAEQAFWCLVSICEKYLPGYYSPGLEAVQLDGEVLYGLIRRMSPPIYKLLKTQRVEPIMYMTEWFMCIYTRSLPWSSVLRVWDIFLCEGVKVMFRVGLVMFKTALGTPEKMSECPSLYETIEKLRNISPEDLEEEYIVREILRLNISERDMEKEHQKQLAKRKAAKENKGKGKKKDSKKQKT